MSPSPPSSSSAWKSCPHRGPGWSWRRTTSDAASNADLHDGIQQNVVALIAGLRLARNRLERGELDADELVGLQEQARETLVDLREIAHGIHPPVLGDNGLVAAVESRVAGSPSRSRSADAIAAPCPFPPGARGDGLLRRVRVPRQRHQARRASTVPGSP